MRDWINIVEGQFDSMMSLDPWSFDQTMSGWRSLPPDQQELALKTYINTYVRGKKFAEDTPAHDKAIEPETLLWHLGQVLAMQDKKVEAVKYMMASKTTDDADWNNYVDSTVAFLKNDKKTFMLLMNKQVGNKETLQRLLSNWGRLYRDAY